MTRYRVWPYKQGSASAKALSEALGGRVLKLEGSRYTYREGDVVINWGSSDTDGLAPINIAADLYDGQKSLNHPDKVRVASNKLLAFQAFREHGVSIPDFWTREEDIPDEVFPVVARTILSGHSGAGIVIAADRASLVRAQLYVRYVKKQDEYRVHVMNAVDPQYPGVGDISTIIAVQKKARRLDCDNPNFQIRNHQNGFIFARENVNPPPMVLEQSIMAIKALGLEFGGVDVIWNERQGRAFVLEVNTACGLEGQTVEDYAQAFRNL